MSGNGPLRVGIGGPVGAGKTSLTEQLAKALAPRCSMAVITNDIYTREDADYLVRAQVLPEARIRSRSALGRIGCTSGASGSCPSSFRIHRTPSPRAT